MSNKLEASIIIILLDPVRVGADSFLGERGGVASWSVGAEVSVQSERGRNTVATRYKKPPWFT